MKKLLWATLWFLLAIDVTIVVAMNYFLTIMAQIFNISESFDWSIEKHVVGADVLIDGYFTFYEEMN